MCTCPSKFALLDVPTVTTPVDAIRSFSSAALPARALLKMMSASSEFDVASVQIVSIVLATVLFPLSSSSAISSPVPKLAAAVADVMRSEEHTSELQSQFHLVCRLLLEKN